MAMADAGPSRLNLFEGWARAAAKLSPRPPHHPAGRRSCMGSQPTLDPAPTRPPDTGQEQHRDPRTAKTSCWTTCRPQPPGAATSSATGPSTRSQAASAATWPPATATTTPARPMCSATPIRPSSATSSATPSRPSTGSTPSSASPPTTRPLWPPAVRDREAALTLGVRVAVHDSRQNDRNPVIWQPGQDYRAADAIHTARTAPIRRGPERTGHER